MNGSSRTRDLDLPLQPDSVRTRRPRRAVIAWLCVVIWAGVIWRLGGDDFSATSTSSTLFEWLRVVFEKVDPRTRYRIIVGIRKSAHFIEYAVLALLTFRAAMISGVRHQMATAAWVALFLVATLASLDEARQAFSPTRTGSPYDVLIDLFGGAVAVSGLLLISRRIRKDTAAARTIGLQ
jgi:VanZ family protein